MRSRRWFERRRIGLGFRPVCAQGWLITFLTAAAVIAVLALLRASAARIPIVVLIFAAYSAVALATGGSKLPVVARPPEPPAEAEQEEAADPVGARPAPVRRPARRGSLPSGEPALVVEHLTKRFEERLAVDDVSFSVATGEVFGFLGPNGAGKTTTVRMLATLIEPTSGGGRVAGVPLDAANGVAIRKRIAVMTENPGLYLRLTVRENLELFAGLYDVADPRERIERALASVNLAGRAGDSCGSLSKGLRQRVAIARALLSDPEIVFLDEPTSGLDPVASREVHAVIDDLRDRGVTVFLTTHRLEEAERLCDRVAILNTSLRTIGRTDELRDRLFRKMLLVTTAAPIADPARVFAGVPGLTDWQSVDTTGYELAVTDTERAAPAVARALVAAGADILSLAERQHSLEDIYLELITDDAEASAR
ncbi:MAG: ABC transporter ATP-binding protein [Acidobacteriota bacterium]|nr:ABC transporter ATP-binding protein [Acidobacteriota bacterium]MDE3191157.1 ABC transporter ATP-binding protein [Acidobacteriota bacterium]